jgi:hypothetical protein
VLPSSVSLFYFIILDIIKQNYWFGTVSIHFHLAIPVVLQLYLTVPLAVAWHIFMQLRIKMHNLPFSFQRLAVLNCIKLKKKKLY